MKPWEKYGGASDAVTTGAPWEKYQAPGKQGMTHTPPTPLRHKLGEALGGVEVRNESDIPFMSRVDLGLTDTAGEFDAKFKAMFPDYDLKRVPTGMGPRNAEIVYKKPGEEFYRRYDEPGPSLGDIADMSAVAPEIALGVGAQFIPGAREAYWANILKGAAGAASGYLAKEGVEEARGYQQEPLKDVLTRAGVIAGMDAAVGAVPALGSFARGKAAGASQGIRDDAAAIRRWMEMNPEAESAMGVQINPSNQLTERLFRQSASTSPDLKAKLERQEITAVDAARQMGEETRGTVGKLMRREGSKRLSRLERDILKNYGVKTSAGPERVGRAAQGALEDFNVNSRAAINEAYNEVRQQITPDMTFDLTPVRQLSDDMGVYATKTDEVPEAIVDLRGQPLTVETIEQMVDVTAPAPQQVAQVARLINQIDPVQPNWEVVKHLRSKVGDAIERWPSDANFGTGQAKRMWAALTDVLENPAGVTQGYKDALTKASKVARDRFEIYEKPSIQALMKSDNLAEIANTMSAPGGMTPVVRETLSKWSPQKTEKVREHIQFRILTENNPTAYRESLMRENPEIIEWAIPKAKRAEFAAATEAMTKLKNSPLNKIVNGDMPNVERSKVALNAAASPGETDNLIRQFGGRGSEGHELLRYSVLSDAADTLIKTKADGGFTIDKAAFAQFIKDAQAKGWWNNILTKQDRTNLQGLEAYARRVIRNLSDTGTSLEQAQLIAGLKNPKTMYSSIHGLVMNNRVIAPLLMSPRFGKMMAGSMRGREPKPGTFTAIFQTAQNLAEVARREDARGWYTEPTPTE